MRSFLAKFGVENDDAFCFIAEPPARIRAYLLILVGLSFLDNLFFQLFFSPFVPKRMMKEK